MFCECHGLKDGLIFAKPGSWWVQAFRHGDSGCWIYVVSGGDCDNGGGRAMESVHFAYISKY